jgi:hypothetical protein
MHIDILRAISRLGPLRLTHVMGETNLGCSDAKRHLAFLTAHRLVERVALPIRGYKTGTAFAVTERGHTALNLFMKLDRVLQLTTSREEQPDKSS